MTDTETDEQDAGATENGTTLSASKSRPFATMLLMGALAIPGTQNAAAQTPSVKAPVTVTVTGAQGDPAMQEKKRSADIRAALLKHAREKFGDIAPLAATGYTQQLQGMQSDINTYLARHNYKAYDGRTAVILSPDAFDAARSIGMTGVDAVREMLEAQGVTASKDAINDLARSMGSRRDTPLGSKFGVYIATRDAKVRENAGTGPNGEDVYVMVPMSSSVSPNQVPGMSYTDNLDFINRHEAWHIKDSRYDLSRFDKATVEAASVGWAPEYLAATPQAREAFAMITRKEALSDVAALGDMIRERQLNSFKLITAVSKWRESNTDDDLHISTPVLKGFRSEVEKMGMGNFLKMDDAAAHEFYYKVVEKYGLSAQTVKAGADYDCASRDEKKQLRAQADRDPELKKALEFLDYKRASHATADQPQQDGDEKIQKKLDKYQPGQLLLDGAFAKYGKITPATLIETRRDMDNELRVLAEKDPKNPLYPLQMAKLQAALINTVQNVDYVMVNARRGVTIENAEPYLQEIPASDQVAASTTRKNPKPPVLR